MSNTKDRSLYLNTRIWVKGDADNGYPLPVGKAKVRKLLRTRTGSGVSHWKDKIRQHQPATSSLDGVWSSFTSVPGYQTTRFRWDPVVGYAGGRTERTHEVKGEIAAFMISEPTVDFTWTSVADGRARNKFLSEVRKVQTQMQGLVFLKELKQTYSMLRRPAEALWKLNESYYSALYQHKRRLGPRRWYYDIPSIWLEYAFGWRPLMMDIDNAWDALNRLLERDYVKRVAGNGSDNHFINRQTGSHNPGSPQSTKNSFLYETHLQERETVRYLGGVDARATTTFADKAAAWGFNPEEFVPSVWEILPWSFLVDYFVSIGDYLDAEFANTASVIWAQKTTRQESIRSYIDIPDIDGVRASLPASSFVSSVGQPSVAKWKKVTVTRRAVAPGSITPALYVKWNGPSLGQWANVSALFGQACSNLHNQRWSGLTFRKSRY